MLAKLFALLPLLTLASAGTLYPSVKIAFAYAVADGQVDQTTFTPIPVDLRPAIDYFETEEQTTGEQESLVAENNGIANLRGVLNFDNTDHPKSFMWSRDTSKYKERKCEVSVTGHPHAGQTIVWDIKAASASPGTKEVKDYVHVKCEPIPQ